MAVVTISRETCSFGDELAKQLAERLQCPLIHREDALERWLYPVADEPQQRLLQESAKVYLHPSSHGATFAELIAAGLTKEAQRGTLVVLGLGAQLIFRDWPDAVHVRVVASWESRRKQAVKAFGLSEQEAERMLRTSDRKHRRYVWEVFGRDWTEPDLYHLVINSDGMSVEHGSFLLQHFLDLKKADPRPLSTSHTDGNGNRNGNSNGSGGKQRPKAFAHPSEAEFAQLLDRYSLRWDYEPTTFPMEWDAEGNVTMAFSPDFYLPEFDTYIELTIMKQAYASIKKKKIRRLKELHPHVNIRMVYKRDFHALVERFGLAKGIKGGDSV